MSTTDLPIPALPMRTTASGRLTLDSSPWADVYLAGRYLGSTPLVNVEVQAGPIELTLINPQLGIQRALKVDIPPGGQVRKTVELLTRPR
jgi:eukaryotic-like serine/threonine-protein kinase